MRPRKMYRNRVGAMFEADFVGTITDPSGVVTTYVLDTYDEEPVLWQNEDRGGEEAYNCHLPQASLSFVLDDPYAHPDIIYDEPEPGPTIGEVLERITFDRWFAKIRRA